MRRIIIGATAGLAIWFGSALAVEAQQITPTGPLAIYVGATGANYTATVTLSTLKNFGVQLKVYRGVNLTNPIWSCEEWVYSPTELVNYFSKNPTWSPSASFGQRFTFKAKLLFDDGSPAIDAQPVVITVSNPPSGPGTYLLPTKPSTLAFEAIDRDRRHEA